MTDIDFFSISATVLFLDISHLRFSEIDLVACFVPAIVKESVLIIFQFSQVTEVTTTI